MIRKRIQFACLFLLIILVFFPVWLIVVQALLPSFSAGQIVLFAEPVRLFTSEPIDEQLKSFLSRHKEIASVLCRDLLWALLSAIVQCIISLISGYLLAKYQSRFSSYMFKLYILTMVIPLQMYLIPTYRISEKINLRDSPLLLYLPVAFSPLGTIFMRQIFIKFPDEYIEAFRLEDKSMTHLIASILFPVSSPALYILFLLSFSESWSMVEQPLILISDKQQYTLGMILYQLRINEPDIIFAASMFALLPVLVFPICIIHLKDFYLMNKENIF